MVYASDQAHSSIEKAALLAGFGREHLRLVATDGAHALRVDALARGDRGRPGRRACRPCAIVATIGTTGTTAIDPVAGIAGRGRGATALWLHVDAALAGTAMVAPECRWMWRGVEEADSLVFNPHKWMGVGFDFSAYYVARSASTSSGDVHQPELPAHRAGRRGQQLPRLAASRSAAASARSSSGSTCSTWASTASRPASGATWRTPTGWPSQVDADPGLGAARPGAAADRLAPPRARRVGAPTRPAGRPQPGHRPAGERGRRAYLTPSVLKGQQTLRVSIGATATERRHVEALWAELQDAAEEA